MDRMNKAEMLIRKSVSEEEKAISDYLERRHQLEKMLEGDDIGSYVFSSKVSAYIEVLDDIIAEEQIHVGQLRQLLNVFEIPLQNEDKGKYETIQTYNKVLEEMSDILREDFNRGK